MAFIFFTMDFMPFTEPLFKKYDDYSELREIISKIRQPNEDPRSSSYETNTKEMAVHFACTQGWFIRLSAARKLGFIKKLLNKLKTIKILQLIINTIPIITTKATMYAREFNTTNAIYDQALRDHDRALDEDALKEVIDSDLKWFGDLSDLYQLLFISGLIRCSGGYICYETLDEARRCCEKLIAEQQINEDAVTTNSTFKAKLNEPVKCSVGSHFQTISSKTTTIKSTTSKPLFENYDKYNPLFIEMQKRRKKWNATIEKYKKQVEPTTSQKKIAAKKQNSKAQDKKSKKGKGQKAKEDVRGGEPDMLQFLPIWIVYKIFSYLDVQTLNKIALINEYWNYAVKQVLLSKKLRITIDKYINQLEATAEKCRPETVFKEISKPSKQAYEGDLPKRRLLKLAERGAIVPTMLRSKLKHKNLKCLITEAMQTSSNCYKMPVGCLGVFPRDFKDKHDSNHFEPRGCIINKLDIKKKKSILSRSEDSLSVEDMGIFDIFTDQPHL